MHNTNREYISFKINFFMTFIILSALILPLSAQEIMSEQTTGETLSFSRVLADLDQSTALGAAREAYETSRKEVESSRYPGDPELSLQPGVKTQYSGEDGYGQTDLTMSTGASFVLGRSLLQEEKYRAARRSLQTELLSLQDVRRQRVSYLYQIYSNLWLLQQEYPILVDDKNLAEEKYEGLIQLYENGAVTLSQVEDGQEDLDTAEDSLNQNLLDQRLTWFTLEQARGLSGSRSGDAIPLLEDVRFETALDEKPAGMTDDVLNTSPEYSKQQDSVTSLTETMTRLERPDWNVLVKPFLSRDDQDWTMTFNWENRNLDLGYAFPMGTFNEAESQSVQQDNWVSGISVTLTLGLGKSDRLEKDLLISERLRQQELQKEQADKLSLELRALYQRFIQARKNLDLAREASKRQSRLKEAVVTRFEAGQALRTDRASAEISERMSLWKVEQARVAVQQIYLSLMVLAGDIAFLDN